MLLIPHALTTRGTVAVKAAGYLVGDEVRVRVDGRVMQGQVVCVRAFEMEVSPTEDLARLFEEVVARP
jgi:hypothetical protein